MDLVNTLTCVSFIAANSSKTIKTEASPWCVNHVVSSPTALRAKNNGFSEIFLKLREIGSTRPCCNLNRPTHAGHIATFTLQSKKQRFFRIFFEAAGKWQHTASLQFESSDSCWPHSHFPASSSSVLLRRISVGLLSRFALEKVLPRSYWDYSRQ